MKKGFTLIELLIVVAIIAILAAIAVPNFLEAQVRSKVSRCKTDMRSMATGIESYFIDNNRYPDASLGDQTPWNERHGFAKYRLFRITTPIAYMTSIPDDPFMSAKKGLVTNGADGDVPGYIYHLARIMWQGNRMDFNAWVESDRNNPSPTRPQFDLCVNSDYPQWILTSQGPDHPDGVGIVYIPYDATNGTVSAGVIVRSGP